MIHYRTHVGCERQVNEDICVYFVDASGKIMLSVVCDGMGGAQGGEVASRVAADTIAEYVKGRTDNITEANAPQILREAYESANNEVLSQAKAQDKEGMGTTAVCAVAFAGKAFIANVGDSRAYLIKDGEISRITRDHSVVWNMVENGEISEEQAKIHPTRNLITKALGTDECKLDDGDLYTVSLGSDDLIVLCTDGLHSLVFSEEILNSAVNSPDHEKACEKLIDLANSRGGYDNITVSIMSTKGERVHG